MSPLLQEKHLTAAAAAAAVEAAASVGECGDGDVRG